MLEQDSIETPAAYRGVKPAAGLSRLDLLGVILSLVAVVVSYLVAGGVFEFMPHLEDEVAYVWQANLAATGRITIASPEYPKSFLVPFVVDYNGLRFGKYPLGWPAVLGVGVLLGVRSWVNPLLAGLGVWLTYRLGKKIFTPGIGLLAGALTVVSPFFLVNSGSLLSHPLGLVLSAAFTLVWLDGFGDRQRGPRLVPTLTAAGLMGCLVLTRPLTAVAVAFPFAIHGLVLLVRGPKSVRRHLILFGVIAALLASLHFLWQYLVTGDPTLNPYTLWWPYDKIGFGPDVGRNGHTINQAWLNTRYSLNAGWKDLFGWGGYSWVFLPFGAWAILKNGRGWLAASIFPSTVLFYMTYWIGSSLFGPRYYYEGLFSLTLLTAAGIFWLAGAYRRDTLGLGWFQQAAARIRKNAPEAPQGEVPGPRSSRFSRVIRWLQPALIFTILVGLTAYNLTGYLPGRLQGMYGLYDMRREAQAPFLTPEAQAMTPALIIVHSERWMGYGVLLDLQSPDLTSPFIFAWSRTITLDNELAGNFSSERTVKHYYIEDPGNFYDRNEPEKNQ